MRTIIAGSRGCTDNKILISALKSCGWRVTTVISGGAYGADELGEEFAKKFKIPYEVYPADWKQHKKSAGYIRNAEMADNAQALVALWDGKSRGTSHMIDIAKRKGLVVYVHMYENVEN